MAILRVLQSESFINARPTLGDRMSYPPSSQFHPRCPFCINGHGLARNVAIAGTTRTVTYRCDHCEQMWSVADRVPFSMSIWSRD